MKITRQPEEWPQVCTSGDTPVVVIGRFSVSRDPSGLLVERICRRHGALPREGWYHPIGKGRHRTGWRCALCMTGQKTLPELLAFRRVRAEQSRAKQLRLCAAQERAAVRDRERAAMGPVVSRTGRVMDKERWRRPRTAA